MGNNALRIPKIEFDLTFPKEYDSKTKIIFKKLLIIAHYIILYQKM
jgi:hypothetical protein